MESKVWSVTLCCTWTGQQIPAQKQILLSRVYVKTLQPLFGAVAYTY
jgi:hypothetical protein